MNKDVNKRTNEEVICDFANDNGFTVGNSVDTLVDTLVDAQVDGLGPWCRDSEGCRSVGSGCAVWLRPNAVLCQSDASLLSA